jgi:hypothetical protein
MNCEAEQKKLHRMAKVQDCLGIWQDIQNLQATEKEFGAHNKQITATGSISDMEELVKASCSLFQHDGAAAFKLLEKSPVPSAWSANDIAGEKTQLLNLRQIKQIDCHPAESDEDNSPDSISDTEHWLNWNGDLDNPNDNEDDWKADNESDIEMDNGSEGLKPPEQWNVSATQNVPGLIRPIQCSQKKVEKPLMVVNIIGTSRNKGIKKK